MITFSVTHVTMVRIASCSYAINVVTEWVLLVEFEQLWHIIKFLIGSFNFIFNLVKFVSCCYDGRVLEYHLTVFSLLCYWEYELLSSSVISHQVTVFASFFKFLLSCLPTDRTLKTWVFSDPTLIFRKVQHGGRLCWCFFSTTHWSRNCSWLAHVGSEEVIKYKIIILNRWKICYIREYANTLYIAIWMHGFPQYLFSKYYGRATEVWHEAIISYVYYSTLGSDCDRYFLILMKYHPSWQN